jgi:hypothetical protein
MASDDRRGQPSARSHRRTMGARLQASNPCQRFSGILAITNQSLCCCTHISLRVQLFVAVWSLATGGEVQHVKHPKYSWASALDTPEREGKDADGRRQEEDEAAGLRGLRFSHRGRYMAVAQRQGCKDYISIYDCVKQWVLAKARHGFLARVVRACVRVCTCCSSTVPVRVLACCALLICLCQQRFELETQDMGDFAWSADDRSICVWEAPHMPVLLIPSSSLIPSILTPSLLRCKVQGDALPAQRHCRDRATEEVLFCLQGPALHQDSRLVRLCHWPTGAKPCF